MIVPTPPWRIHDEAITARHSKSLWQNQCSICGGYYVGSGTMADGNAGG